MRILTVEHTGHEFEDWANLGDDIQSLAAKKLLPRLDGGVSKGSFGQTTDSGVISVNGFFLGGAEWPPAEGLVPFFYSFHISPASEKEVCSESGLAYLRRFEPIGCRDQGTMETLLSHGIKAYYSKCLSLTFPRRKSAPRNGKIFLVSLSKGAVSALPRKVRKKGIVVEQAKLRIPAMSAPAREALAQHLLDVYARDAALVITSKIHCAMPCIAMGIPVVFLYDRKKKNDRRVSIVKELIGINYVGESSFFRRFINPIIGRFFDWSPEPVDIEKEKQEIKAGYLKALDTAIERYCRAAAEPSPS